MNVAASIHARLLNEARARGIEFNLLLRRYFFERFLYRVRHDALLARSPIPLAAPSTLALLALTLAATAAIVLRRM